MRGWRPPDSGADKHWRRSSVPLPPATHFSPLPPLFPRVLYYAMDWAAEGRKSLLRRFCGEQPQLSLKGPRCFPHRGSAPTSRPVPARSAATKLFAFCEDQPHDERCSHAGAVVYIQKKGRTSTGSVARKLRPNCEQASQITEALRSYHISSLLRDLTRVIFATRPPPLGIGRICRTFLFKGTHFFSSSSDSVEGLSATSRLQARRLLLMLSRRLLSTGCFRHSSGPASTWTCIH